MSRFSVRCPRWGCRATGRVQEGICLSIRDKPVWDWNYRYDSLISIMEMQESWAGRRRKSSDASGSMVDACRMVTTVEDYLDLSPADARAQWRSVLARSPVAPGRRQVGFVPVGRCSAWLPACASITAATVAQAATELRNPSRLLPSCSAGRTAAFSPRWPTWMAAGRTVPSMRSRFRVAF
jgi:hypothetical protein